MLTPITLFKEKKNKIDFVLLEDNKKQPLNLSSFDMQSDFYKSKVRANQTYFLQVKNLFQTKKGGLFDLCTRKTKHFPVGNI